MWPWSLRWRSHILKQVLRLVAWFPLSLFYQECSYIKQWLPLLCRLQPRPRNTDMTFNLRPRSRSNILKICQKYVFRLLSVIWIHFSDGGCSYLVIGQCLMIVWKLQQRQITDMTLNSNVKVTYIIKTCLRFATRICFSFFTEGVHIRHNDCQWCLDYNKGLGIWIRPWSQRSLFNILKICRTAGNASSTFILLWRGFRFKTLMKLRV